MFDNKKNSEHVTSKRFLAPGEPLAFSVVNGQSLGAFLVVCDHASAAIPCALGDLGLSPAERARHIAWDIGAKDVALHVAKKLDAACVLAGYSRLVIDLNRDPGHPGSILEESDKTPVPGNRALAPPDRQMRVAALYEPYHAEIRRQLDVRRNRGQAPVLISIHSFTPRMGGQERPWHIGILWNDDGRLARPLMRELASQNPGLVIGDNEPYSARQGPEFNNTIEIHAGRQGFASVMIEFRQDTVDTPDKAAGMAEVFLRALAALPKESFFVKLRA